MNETFKTELAEFARDVKAICKEQLCCEGCPLGTGDTKPCAANYNNFDAEAAIAAVEKWRNRDCSKRIDPTECVRVFTLEFTDIRTAREDGTTAEVSQEYLKERGDKIAKDIQGEWQVDDVKCVKAQQFVTKWREVE